MLVGRPGKVHMTPAEVNAVNDRGVTALHLAALKGFDQICGVFLAAGARLDAKTPLGDNTPLMLAQQFQPSNGALLALLSGNVPAQSLCLTCDQCGLTAEQASVKVLKGCGKCFVMRYCGKDCQAAAWPGHKEACKARTKAREQSSRVENV